MTFLFYTVLHVFGIMLLFASLGGLATLRAVDVEEERARSVKRLLAAGHGLALVFILVAGFGLMAKKLAMFGSDWPGWIYAKIVIWLIFGASIMAFKKPALAKPALAVLVLLGGLAAYIAIYKPF